MATDNLPAHPMSHLPAPAPVPVTPGTYVSADPDEPVFLLTVVRKRWWLLLICLVVSGLVGFGYAKSSSSLTVESEASLLYSGLPMGPRVYEAPAIGTHSALLASPSNLNRLIEMHGLETTPQRLERNIKVKSGDFRSATIDIHFTWNDKREAVQLLDDLMEIFIENVVQRRLETIDSHIRHTERLLLASIAKADEAAERRRANQQREGDSLQKQMLTERELESVSAGVESIKTALEAAEFKKISLQTEIDTLSALSQQEAETQAEAYAQLQKSYKQQLLSDVRSRYDEALKNYGPKSSARARLQKVGQQLGEIEAAIEEDHDLAEWTMQLMEIDSIITPQGTQYQNDPRELYGRDIEKYEREMEKIESRLRDLHLSLMVNDQVIELLKTRLANKETELQEKMQDVLTTGDYAQQLQSDYEEANAERQRIQQQLSGLRQLQECRVREFSVVTPAYVATVDSNTRKLFVMTVFFSMIVLSAPIFAVDYFADRAVTVEQTGRKFGLPVLSQVSLAAQVVDGTVNASTSDVDALRLLALRIQQSISQPGATVLFSGLDHNESTFPLLCGLARCFSEREERVLILDAGKSVVANEQQLRSLFGELRLPQVQLADHDQDQTNSDGSPPANGTNSIQPTNGSTDSSISAASGPKGLSDYLSLDDMTPADIIAPTRFSGVDCICSGTRPFPVEGLATRRMSDLFDRARKHYGLVLVAGPPSDKLADVQMLAARADGILFTVDPKKPLTNHSHEVLQELLHLEAPIIGIVG